MVVAIIGAGPAGLTLARLLQSRGISTKIFEHDASFDARDQGGTFDLHSNGGQKALLEAGLFDEFTKLSRPEGQATKVFDKSGILRFEQVAEVADFSRPEIDRQVLRKLLLDSLEAETVEWNKHLLRAETVDEGKCKLIFKDGTEVTADFVVGADGTWSKVRGLVSQVKPVYTGVTFIEIRIADPDQEISALVGEGSLFALGDNKALLGQRNGDRSIRVYVANRVPEDWQTHFDFSNVAEIRTELMKTFNDWDPKLLELINLCENKFTARALYEMPLDEFWETSSIATVIGDAAHVMSPFGGQGANLAMVDALELANCLSSAEFKESPLTAVRSFEETMIGRASNAAFRTKMGLNACLAPDAPAGLVQFFEGHRGPPEQNNQQE